MKSKSFYALLIGQSLANMGDVLYIVALISFVYSITTSTLIISFIPVSTMVAGVISGFCVPLIIDRYNLKSILVVSQFLKTVFLFCLLFYIYSWSQSIFIPCILILVILINFMDGFAMPASSAILPSLVSKDELLKANSLISTLNQIIQLSGWALGGILAVYLKSYGLIILTVVLYLFSVIVMLFIEVNIKQKTEERQIKKTKLLFEGWELILRNPLLLRLHLIMLFETFATTVWISAIMYPFIKNRLEVSIDWWGYINTALLLGFLLAGLYGYKKYELLEKHKFPTIILGSFIVFLATFFFGLNTSPWMALLIISIYGIFQELKTITVHTIIQNVVSENLLAKVYAAESILIMGTFGVSTLMMGVIGETFSIEIVYLLASMFLFIAFVITLFSRKPLTKID
ncbi:MFS transporter [Paenibacillus wulumuqiensis]|uniref:MFS transporter n=1 Tax=Paenibacillus wulumuqiensis TaxID=1567107 RepID=UPI000619A222|nr:MFS transporter [Paenibacillus wulumuqiensis]